MGNGLMRINEMGLYKVYQKLPEVKHGFRWKSTPRPLTERERLRKRMMEKPIDEMGIYLMLKDFSKKTKRQRAAEQAEMRRLHANGQSIAGIADIFGCDEELVRNRLSAVWRDDEK